MRSGGGGFVFDRRLEKVLGGGGGGGGRIWFAFSFFPPFFSPLFFPPSFLQWRLESVKSDDHLDLDVLHLESKDN